MSATKREDGVLWIEEYSLADFAIAIQNGAKEGYEVSLANKNYPQGFSGHFTVGMVIPEPKVEAPAAAPTAPTTRKAKPKAE